MLVTHPFFFVAVWTVDGITTVQLEQLNVHNCVKSHVKAEWAIIQSYFIMMFHIPPCCSPVTNLTYPLLIIIVIIIIIIIGHHRKYPLIANCSICGQKIKNKFAQGF